MARSETGLPPSATRRRRGRLAVALVGALSVAGLVAIGAQPSGSDDPSRRPAVIDQGGAARGGIEARDETVAAMLARRGEALVEQDRAAFLDTVDPENAELRTDQARLFDNLDQVPLAQWSYDLDTEEDSRLPDRARDLLAALGAESFAANAVVRVRIRGYDSEPADHDQVLVFTPRDGRWYVSGIFDAPGGGDRQLWDAGKVHVLTTRYALVLGLRRADLRPIADEVEAAVPRVDAVWGTAWARRVLVLVTRTEDEMAGLLGGKPATYRQLAAITRGELGAAEGTGAAERVIINPRAYAELSDIGRRVIMVHEIAHVAARAFTQPWTPTWLTEGFADYIGYRGSGLAIRFIAQELVTDVENGFSPRQLPADSAFDAASTRLPQAYEMAWLACRLIVEQYGGQATLLEFLRAVGAPGGGAAAVDAAFDDVLDTTRTVFTAQWQDYLRTTLT